MPEGHTIHRLARDHTRDYVGQRLAVSSPQGRFADGAAAVDGRGLARVEAYGKHLFYWWDSGDVVHVHLGLYGKFRRHRVSVEKPVPEPRGAVRMRVVGDEKAFDLNGPAACEVMDSGGRDAIAARLGEDPLRGDVDVDAARDRVMKSRAAVGRLLLDQSVIAGVGNIFRAEALFIAGIHPERAGNELAGEEFDRLWSAVCEMLKVGVKYNRIITTDPAEVGVPRGRMKADQRVHVYKKERCPRCDGRIKAWEVGARMCFACPRCQPKRGRR